MGKPDYYDVLEVPRDADVRTIKKAFREKSLQYHPDRNPGDQEAEETFKLVAESYDVLGNDEKRRLYDQFGHEGVRSAGFSGFQNVEDIFSHFSDFFGEFFGFGQRRPNHNSPLRGENLQVDLEISYEEAATGIVRDVIVKQPEQCDTCDGVGAAPGTKPEPCSTCGGQGQVQMRQGFLLVSTSCPHCQGQGQTIKKRCQTCQGSGRKVVEKTISVEIPPGIGDGMRIRHRGRGGEGVRGGPAGDLFILVRLEEHPELIRNGYDIHSEVAISYTRAALGQTILIPALGEEKEIEISPGTQPGDTITLRKGGFPYLPQDGRGIGDHIVHIRVVIPQKLSKEEKELLEQLTTLEKPTDGRPMESNQPGRPKKKSIFQRIKEAVE